MHRNTKRLVSGLLAAAFGLLVLPRAAAEPWTYEVDAVMATYGVEYYPDVGFEDPRLQYRKDTTGTTDTAGTANAAAGAIAETYSMQDSGVAVYADNSNTTGTDDYTVVIPSELTFTESDSEKNLSISGTVQNHRILTIGVASENSYALKNADTKNYAVGYKVTLTDGTGITANDTGKTYTVETTDAAVNYSTAMKVTLDEDRSDAKVSGDYTDTLTFTMECTKKPTVTVRYESMDSTIAVTSGSALDGYPRTSVWENVSVEEVEVGKTYTYTNASYNDLEWENQTCEVTITADQTDYYADFLRKMYSLDLNTAVWVEEEGRYVNPHGQTSGSLNEQGWGRVQATINGKKRYNAVFDYYTAHPVGTKYQFELVELGTDYKVVGHGVNLDISKLQKGECTPLTGNIGDRISGSLDSSSVPYPSDTPRTNKTYGGVTVWIFVEKIDTATESSEAVDDATTLLPSWDDTTKPVVIDTSTADTVTAQEPAEKDTDSVAVLPMPDKTRPVAVEMPAADTAADTANTAKDADTTADTGKDTADAAEDPDTASEEEVLRIMDADEMLAEFALQDEDPV